MFRLEETELNNAIDRCKEMHPTVRVINYGEYSVTGSKEGSAHTVKCFRDDEGFKTVDCSCKTRDGVACKHAMGAVALHLYLATVEMILKRRAQRQAIRTVIDGLKSEIPSDESSDTAEHIERVLNWHRQVGYRNYGQFEDVKLGDGYTMTRLKNPSVCRLPSRHPKGGATDGK